MVVIDDEPAIRDATLSLFPDGGTKSSRSAPATRRSCAFRLARPGPSLIICDYRLRDGENGMAVMTGFDRNITKHFRDLDHRRHRSRRLSEAKTSGLLLMHNPCQRQVARGDRQSDGGRRRFDAGLDRQMRPIFRATAAAWVRLSTFIARKIAATWAFTVFSERPSSMAIVRFVRPSVISRTLRPGDRSTSRHRVGFDPAGGAGEGRLRGPGRDIEFSAEDQTDRGQSACRLADLGT